MSPNKYLELGLHTYYIIPTTQRSSSGMHCYKQGLAVRSRHTHPSDHQLIRVCDCPHSKSCMVCCAEFSSPREFCATTGRPKKCSRRRNILMGRSHCCEALENSAQLRLVSENFQITFVAKNSHEVERSAQLLLVPKDVRRILQRSRILRD